MIGTLLVARECDCSTTAVALDIETSRTDMREKLMPPHMCCAYRRRDCKCGRVGRDSLGLECQSSHDAAGAFGPARKGQADARF